MVPHGGGRRLQCSAADNLERVLNRRPKLFTIAPGASPEEAAAVAAALEQFMWQTTPVIVPEPPAPNPWAQAALHEGVSRQPELPLPWA
jgi:hypothetical protein